MLALCDTCRSLSIHAVALEQVYDLYSTAFDFFAR